jgi:Anti-sigma factor NepR
MAARDPGKRKHAPTMNIQDYETSTSVAPETAAGVMMEADLQAHIGRQLRAVYDEVVNEPVPDRFVKLLEELERKQSDGA